MASNNSEEEDVDFNEETDLRDNASVGIEDEYGGNGDENPRPSSPTAEAENADESSDENKSVGKKRLRESYQDDVDDGDTEPKQKKMGALTTARGHASKKTSIIEPPEKDRRATRNPESKPREDKDSERILNVLFVSRYGHTKPIYEKDLEELFRPYGSFQRVTMKGPISFVDFENSNDAIRAKKELHQTPALNSDSIIVDFKKRGEGNFDKNNRSRDAAPIGRFEKNVGRDRERDGFRDGPYRKPSDSYGSHFDDTHHRPSSRDFQRDFRDVDRRPNNYDNKREHPIDPKYDDRGGYNRYNGPGGGRQNDSARDYRPPYDDRDYPAPQPRVPIPKGLPPPPANSYPPSNNRNYLRDDYPPYDSGNNHRSAPFAHSSGKERGPGPPPGGDYPRSYDGNSTRPKDRSEGFGYGPSRQSGPPPSYNDSRPPGRGGDGGYPSDHGGYGGGGYKAPYDANRKFGPPSAKFGPPSAKFDGYQGEPYRGGGGGGGGRGSGY